MSGKNEFRAKRKKQQKPSITKTIRIFRRWERSSLVSRTQLQNQNTWNIASCCWKRLLQSLFWIKHHSGKHKSKEIEVIKCLESIFAQRRRGSQTTALYPHLIFLLYNVQTIICFASLLSFFIVTNIYISKSWLKVFGRGKK